MAKLELHGAAIINGAAGTITNQTGMVTSVTHTGAGDWTLNLDADFAIDAAECVAAIQMIGAVAASGNTTFGLVHTSDVAKQVTCVQEQGGGAASAAADVNFSIVLMRIDP
jgi:hypothetical protein